MICKTKYLHKVWHVWCTRFFRHGKQVPKNYLTRCFFSSQTQNWCWTYSQIPNYPALLFSAWEFDPAPRTCTFRKWKDSSSCWSGKLIKVLWKILQNLVHPKLPERYQRAREKLSEKEREAYKERERQREFGLMNCWTAETSPEGAVNWSGFSNMAIIQTQRKTPELCVFGEVRPRSRSWMLSPHLTPQPQSIHQLVLMWNIHWIAILITPLSWVSWGRVLSSGLVAVVWWLWTLDPLINTSRTWTTESLHFCLYQDPNIL